MQFGSQNCGYIMQMAATVLHMYKLPIYSTLLNDLFYQKMQVNADLTRRFQ